MYPSSSPSSPLIGSTSSRGILAGLPTQDNSWISPPDRVPTRARDPGVVGDRRRPYAHADGPARRREDPLLL